MRKISKNSFFSDRKNPRISINIPDTNMVQPKLSPIPQIVINEISIKPVIFQNSQISFIDNRYLNTTSESLRAHSSSPLTTKRCFSPTSIANKIEVKTPKIQTNKRKGYLDEKRYIIKQKARVLAEKLMDLKILRKKNEDLRKEMKTLEYNRNRLTIYAQLQKDYKVLNGLLYEVLTEEDRIRGGINLIEAVFKGFYDKIKLNERKNKGSTLIFEELKMKYMKFKIFEELQVINFALEREFSKKKHTSY